MQTEAIISAEAAAHIMLKMRALFGDKFDKQWSGIARDDMVSNIQDVLTGLDRDELMRGLDTMRTKTFCPTLPEFRAWCRPDTNEWLSADQAWAIAIKSLDELETVVWTAEMSKAFGFVRALLEMGDKFSAARAFKERYAELVEQASAKGGKPKMFASLGHDPDHRIAALQEAQDSGLMNHAVPEVKHLIESKAPLSAKAKEHLENLKKMLATTHERIDKNKAIVERKAELIEQLKTRQVDS